MLQLENESVNTSRRLLATPGDNINTGKWTITTTPAKSHIYVHVKTMFAQQNQLQHANLLGISAPANPLQMQHRV